MSQSVGKEELEEFQNPTYSPNATLEIKELIKRVEKNDKEIQVLTEALKTTLSDVRTVIQDIDNPFNLLKNMGVDNLVDQAVEKVTDGVKKAKREFDTKKAMEEDVPIEQKNLLTSTKKEDLKSKPGFQEIENKINELEDKLGQIISLFDKNSNSNIISKKYLNNNYNYNVYVTLLSDYLYAKYGEKKAKNILLSALYKGWASSKIIRDIMINIDEKDIRVFDSKLENYGYEWMNENSEDKTLIISLLNRLENIQNKEDPSFMFLLLNLIKNLRENPRVNGNAQ